MHLPSDNEFGADNKRVAQGPWGPQQQARARAPETKQAPTAQHHLRIHINNMSPRDPNKPERADTRQVLSTNADKHKRSHGGNK